MSATLLYARVKKIDQKSSAQGGIGGERFWVPGVEKIWGVSPFLLKKKSFFSVGGGYPWIHMSKCEILCRTRGDTSGVKKNGSRRGVLGVREGGPGGRVGGGSFGGSIVAARTDGPRSVGRGSRDRRLDPRAGPDRPV